MKIEVAPAGTDPTKRRYDPARRGGGSEFIQDNKWLLLAVVVFLGFTAWRFGWFAPPERSAAAPVAAPTAAVVSAATPERRAAPAGWCTGPLPVAGFEEQIRPGYVYAPARYVLELSDEGRVKLAVECVDGGWVFFEPDS